jgi:hypothetical protein
MNLQCIDGEWKPERQGLQLIPDCERNNLSLMLLMFNLMIEISWCFQQPAIRLALTAVTVYRTTFVNAQKTSEALNVNGERSVVRQQKWSSTAAFPVPDPLILFHVNWVVPRMSTLSSNQLKFILVRTQRLNFCLQMFHAVFSVNFSFPFVKVSWLKSFPVHSPTKAPGMQVIQSKPITSYSQTNGTLVKKSGGKKVVVEPDSGEDEEIEETQTIIKKTIIRKKGKKTYVRFWKFKNEVLGWESALEKFVIVFAGGCAGDYLRGNIQIWKSLNEK